MNNNAGAFFTHIIPYASRSSSSGITKLTSLESYSLHDDAYYGSLLNFFLGRLAYFIAT